MHRIVKLLGIICILGIVSFIICDEKGIKVELNDNHIVFNKVEKSEIYPNETIKVEYVEELNQQEILYKNTDIIRIFPGFNNPNNLRKSNGMDQEFLAKIEEEKARLKSQSKQVYTGPTFIAVNNKDTVSSIFSSSDNDINHNNKDFTDDENSGDLSGLPEDLQSELNIMVSQKGDIQGEPIKVSVPKYKIILHHINLKKGKDISLEITEDNLLEDNSIVEENYVEGDSINSSENIIDTGNKINLVSVEKYYGREHSILLNKGKEIILPTVSMPKYQLENRHTLNLKNGHEIIHEFSMPEEDLSEQNGEVGLSNELLESLLSNEDIDVNSIDSENDEFLQRIFLETKDTDVMNLIVENYLNEYQFIKAKKFIENLPDMYKKDLKPSLNLRLVFNSFALSSKTTNETLTKLIQDYQVNDQILEEDRIWYLGVLALMQQDYNSFFEIANGFTSERHKNFTTKLQGYKNQISKQMGMPDYYFDTLVALELFNQGLFQPAKVLALSSLQQNSNYILPYQVLAYANFLTNTWDTSIEYLKKLVDLDPNNAEKYRFLMGIAYYWNGKYEQSVIMLSLIKDEKLRLDSERYLISNYLILDQKNKLILSRNKLLGYDGLVASDFYTYFYEAFYHPYSEGFKYEIYAFDTELADKMIRVCNMRLSGEESVVCTYGNIGKNIALGQFEGLEQSLLKLVSEYPQGYLYHALGEYYLKQGDMERAKLYLLKAVSLVQKRSEINQIKELLQGAIN